MRTILVFHMRAIHRLHASWGTDHAEKAKKTRNGSIAEYMPERTARVSAAKTAWNKQQLTHTREIASNRLPAITITQHKSWIYHFLQRKETKEESIEKHDAKIGKWYAHGHITNEFHCKYNFQLLQCPIQHAVLLVIVKQHNNINTLQLVAN